MPATTVDVVLRLLGSRKFQAEAAKSAAALGGMEKGAAATGTRVKAAGARMSAVGSTMTRTITAPMALAGAASVKLAADFEGSMRNVNSIAQLPEPAFQRMQQQVLAMAGPTAQAPKTLADGLYDLVSSGFKGQQAMQVLKASATAATAGLTDTATSTKVIAATLNAYRLPASKAQLVSDVLFRTVDRGVISFEELSGTIGQTLPFASRLGVGIKQVGASIATMTKQGLSGAEASTRLRNLLITMTKGSEGLNVAYKELGVTSGEQLIKQRGLQGALEAVVGTTNGSSKAINKLFPNIRAAGGAMSLTGKNAKTAAADLRGMGEASGATGRALGQQSKSMSFQWKQATAEMKVAMIQFGLAIMPVIKPIITAITAIASAFASLPGPVRTVILVFGGILAVAGPMLVMFGAVVSAVGTLITVFPALGTALLVLRTAWATMWAAAFGPVGIIIAAVVALGVVFVVLYKKVGWFRRGVQAVWGWIKKNWPLLLSILGGPITAAAYVIIKNWQRIKAGAAAVISWLKGAWGSIKGVITDVASKVSGPLKSAFNTLKAPVEALLGVWRQVLDTISNIAGKVSSLPGKALDVLGLQTGGTVSGARTALVGERGPELLHLPGGTRVQPLPQGPQVSAGAAGGQTIRVPVYLDGRVLTEAVADRVRQKQARS